MGNVVKNTFLYLNTVNSNMYNDFTPNFNTAQFGIVGKFLFLPTIIMPLYTGKDSTYKVRTLLDSGAGHSWIAKGILKYINYTKMPTQRLTIGTLSGSVKRKCMLVQVYFRTHTLIPIKCFVPNDFVEHIMVHGVKKYLREQTTLQNEIIDRIVDPADTNVDHARLSMGTALVLSNAATALVCPSQSTRLNIQEHRLILEQTIFGITLSGEIPQSLRANTQVVQALNTVPCIDKNACSDIHCELGYEREVLEDEIKFLWDKSDLGIFSHEVHDDDLIAVKRLEDSLKHLESGHFEIGLPFNAKLQLLETNKQLAMARTYKQLAEMAVREVYRKLTIKAKEELESNDYIERVTSEMIPVGKVHYLPWRGIMKTESDTTKLRLVMDASAKKSASQVSLNQCLYQGPNMILNLAQCLIRFMLDRYRCVADIEKAFLRILIAQEDRDVLRFFWPEDPCDPNSYLLEYRWKAVLFGSIASPFILATVLKRLVTDSNASEYAKDALLQGIYVDNLFHSDKYEQNLVTFFGEARGILQQGNFNLREWGSNSKELRNRASLENVLIKKDKVSALGLWWDQVKDTLTFKANFKWNLKHTKRSVLSFTNAVFDPLNWICPLHLQNRLFIRNLWALKYKWDQSFGENQELVERWAHLRHNCFSAVSIVMNLDIEIRSNTEIHLFSDASTQAYGAVLYVVTPISAECPPGEVRLIKARGKIVPVDKNPTEDTIPRWELCSIVIASNLLVFVKDAVPQLKGKRSYIWNDNKPALAWCSQTEIKDTYIHNRVKLIRQRCPDTIIKYVPTHENPADILTREITAEGLKNSQLWWKAPKWITQPTQWPVTEQVYNLHPLVLPQHNNIPVLDINNPLRLDLPSLHVFADHRFARSTRALAWILRWRNKWRRTNKYHGEQITSQEMEESKIEAIKIMQKSAFSQELETLRTKGIVKNGKCAKLRLFLDKVGVIRCYQRVQYTILKEDHKAPVLVDTQSSWTSSYIKNIHVSNGCAQYHYTLNAIRQEIHGFRLPDLVKKVIGRCHICIRFRAHPYRYPVQPVLPLERVIKDNPFTYTGVDYIGYFQVLSGNTTIKVWVCLFTCMVSRAIYMVLLDNMKSTTFLTALKELSTRRSQPKLIISDNATCFTHGAKILEYISTQKSVKKQLATLGIEWKHTPAKAAWHGAIYERLVGIIKRELHIMCGNGIFTKEDFRIHLLEVERVVNSRPLCRTQSEEVITPNHILNGLGSIRGSILSTKIAEDTLEQILESRKELPKFYEQVKKRKELFWEKLQQQYLESIRFTADRVANKFIATPQVGDICIVYEDSEPRFKWKIAQIKSNVMSKDGQVRSCVIQTENVTTTRPVNHLYKLEIDVEDNFDNALQIQQADRARANEEPLKELRDRITQEAQDSDLPEKDIHEIIQKINHRTEVVNQDKRPRRQAAIKASELRRQLLEENAL